MRTAFPHRAVARLAAATRFVLHEVIRGVKEGQPADAVLAALFRRHREWGGRDRRFIGTMVFSFFRWKGWTDRILRGGEEKAALIAYFLDADDPHPVVEHMAAAAGWAAHGLAPMGTFSLEEKAKRLAIALGGDPPPWHWLVPDWLREELMGPKDGTGEEWFHQVVEAFQVRPPTWLRVALGDEDKLREVLQNAGVTAVPHTRLPGALAVPPGTDLQRLVGQGRFQVQDIASQVVGWVCAPSPGETWWDACAGGGGKTLHLADLIGPTGQVLATDTRSFALKELSRRVRRANVRTVRTIEWDARNGRPTDWTVDGVLVDAPCTGIGTWARNPDARWRLQRDEIARAAARQAAILEGVADSVRRGGRLVYATCTLTWQENENVVMTFLARRSDYVLEPFENPLDGEPTDGCLLISPWEGPGTGMFIARFRRVGR